jgi:hypothetical protein
MSRVRYYHWPLKRVKSLRRTDLRQFDWRDFDEEVRVLPQIGPNLKQFAKEEILRNLRVLTSDA